MSSIDLEKTFVISETGDSTGEKFTGTFVVKCLLSKREEMAADLRRRMILGPSPDAALNSISNDAWLVGQLSVRILRAPSWWEQSDGGLDLRDNNVLAKVFEESMKAELEYRETIAKAAENAVAKNLAKLAEKTPGVAPTDEDD